MICDRCRAPIRQPLTLHQKKLYDFIAACIRANGVAPTFAEMTAYTGRSIATLHEHMSNLERKGWIVRRFNEERGMSLVEDAAL